MNAAYISNLMPSQEHGTSRSELFTWSLVPPNLWLLHTFGCPVYILNNRLRTGKSIPKWQPRARLGLNLVPSPRHRRQVSLLLSPITGLVSPQYHVSHDDFFETTTKDSGNPKTQSTWQKLSGLTFRQYDPHNKTNIFPIPAGNDIQPRMNKGIHKTQNQQETPKTVDEDPVHPGGVCATCTKRWPRSTIDRTWWRTA